LKGQSLVTPHHMMDNDECTTVTKIPYLFTFLSPLTTENSSSIKTTISHCGHLQQCCLLGLGQSTYGMN